ncbi:MAG: YceI family protein [Deltaproteobacteria bacterium]|nr:MAG: YceI family protein [Deltaproteobacteria bacterium]
MDRDLRWTRAGHDGLLHRPTWHEARGEDEGRNRGGGTLPRQTRGEDPWRRLSGHLRGTSAKRHPIQGNHAGNDRSGRRKRGLGSHPILPPGARKERQSLGTLGSPTDEVTTGEWRCPPQRPSGGVAMPRFDARNAECFVFTYKEGLLSPLAHDLKIRVTRFEIEVAADLSRIEAFFDPNSLRVVCAMRNDIEAPDLLRAKDIREIEENITRKVLETSRYREIRFTATAIEPLADGAWRVAGDLSLHGRTRPITFEVVAAQERYSCRVCLHQPDFGIRPFSAMFNTLKIQPDLFVSVSLPQWTPQQA